MTKWHLGRHVYGLGGIALGVTTLVWRQIEPLQGMSHPAIVIYIAGIAECAGGLALLWQKTAKIGAVIVSAIFSVFSLYWFSHIVQTPLVFDPWGIFFEQFSIVLGGVFVFAATIRSDPERASTITKAAYVSYGICVITYALYQLFYLAYTAGLVPKWIPPGQMFWSVATTIAFALAAVALLSGRAALLASRLLTAMLILFGALVWLPALFSEPGKASNWQEFSANLAMAGAAWIVTDLLSGPETLPRGWPFVRVQEKS